MAKENKKQLGPLPLFGLAVLLLTGGWLMKSFPIFLFAGLAPLIALTDHVKKDDSFWESSEWILITLSVAIFAGHFFDFGTFISTMIQAIAFTLVFVMYTFAHQNLGDRLGKLPIVFFWLALEYVYLKLQWPAHFLFLADGFALKTEWLRWTSLTGYLGVSLWIVFCNLLLYYAYFKTGQINWILFIIFLMTAATPMIYSYTLSSEPITRLNMINYYNNITIEAPAAYLKRGEFIPRTAAWISVLIVLFAIVKNQTRKK